MFDSKSKSELKKGNPEAFKEIFRILYPRMKGYCSLFVKNRMDAEDIIQECFIILWEKRADIDVNRRIESFMFVILRNRCLNYLKSQNLNLRQIPVENVKIEELQYLYQLDFIKREEKSLEEQLISSFQEAVNDLPHRMKDVFVKCKIEGIKQKEVADELGISVKAVEKHISAAKEKIRCHLLKKYNELGAVVTFIMILFEDLL